VHVYAGLRVFPSRLNTTENSQQRIARNDHKAGKLKPSNIVRYRSHNLVIVHSNAVVFNE